MNWTIGVGLEQVSDCCVRRFARVYGVTKNKCEVLCSAIKRRDYSSTLMKFHDRLDPVSSSIDKKNYFDRLMELCSEHNIELSHEQVLNNHYSNLSNRCP
jgi:hypothetical protein